MYQIFKNRKVRRRTDYIILTQATNMIQEDFKYIDPIVNENTYLYTWGIWQKYFYKNLKRKSLPCHYFCELLDDDYVIYNGLGICQPSYFLTDLVNSGVIDFQYRDSIVIALGDNYNKNTLNKRMMEQLSSKVIYPLLREYGLSPIRVKYIDECLTNNWEVALQLSQPKYLYTKVNNFDTTIMKNIIDNYKI